MASFSSGANPNVVKTALDDVFDQAHNVKLHPQYADATTRAIFHQDTADNAAVIWEQFKGAGLWQTKLEEQDVPEGTPNIGGQKTFTVTEYAQRIEIPKNFFDDNMHGAYEKMVRDFARKAIQTRDSNAFAVFRNAFTTATTYDGTAFISDSHTNRGGYTIDNKASGALSETSLNTMIIQLLELKSQDGVVGGSVPTCLLVPPALYKTACEITESKLRSGTTDNDMNVYSDKYGIRVYTSQFLGAAAGGSDTAYYLLSDDHSVYRFVRQGVETTLVDWRNALNNNYIYKGTFRETVGAFSFEGIVGAAS
jgi:hypothetical protein